MLLKNHLIEVFKKASLENNFLLKENIVLKWVHRFGIDSLNDLLIYSPVQKENQHEEENQEQISLINEVHEEENQEQISLINEVHEEENQEQISLINEVHEEENQEQISLINEVHEEENQEQISLINEVHEEENQEQISLIDEVHEEKKQEKMKWESTVLQNSRSNKIISKYEDLNKTKQYTTNQKSPLPYIKNLRKWINKDKKAS
ncbi:MAG: glycoprotein [Prochlorococcus marinus CUG1433]|uniref:Glycoprotein n=1 Tax=Prochlorococcus marinus CUG1433 TaxID=2774506 RepID=A0A9D9BSU5_PROMR|nr:glycoprotein [Prochlorococcus marinus CUG1433]